MILADFCKTLGFSADAEKVLAPVWQEVVENFPGELAFLEDDFQKEWYPRIGNHPDFLPELLRVLQTVRNTPVLILDEATSAVDNKTEAEIQRAIENLTGRHTLIVIAHRLSTVMPIGKQKFFQLFSHFAPPVPSVMSSTVIL